jgi:hypothetical protein
MVIPSLGKVKSVEGDAGQSGPSQFRGPPADRKKGELWPGRPRRRAPIPGLGNVHGRKCRGRPRRFDLCPGL